MAELIPSIPDARDQDAWLAFIDETTPAREAYSAALAEAARRRDEDLAAINATAVKARHQVWEQHNGMVSEAWRIYMSDTESARLRRESATYVPSQLVDAQ